MLVRYDRTPMVERTIKHYDTLPIMIADEKN